jgi:hypothetical protein
MPGVFGFTGKPKKSFAMRLAVGETMTNMPHFSSPDEVCVWLCLMTHLYAVGGGKKKC